MCRAHKGKQFAMFQPCDVDPSDRPSWKTPKERDAIDRTKQFTLPVGLTHVMILKGVRRAMKQMWGESIQSSTSRIIFAHGSDSLFNEYPYDYAAPFKFDD